MDFNQVKELLNLVDQSSLKEFHIQMDNATIQMSKNTSSMQSNVETILPEKQAATTKMPSIPTNNEYMSAASETPVETEAVSAKEGKEILSPIVGVVYLSPEPGKPEFKKVGDIVKVGETICIVEAMKVMNEIKSEQEGIIEEVLVEDSQVVEYNQPLFRIV